VTPVEPVSKRACLRNWQQYPANDLREVEKWAARFPDHSAGVVAKRYTPSKRLKGGTVIPGHFGLCLVDVDADGLLEGIERETGRRIPDTFTVQSRPLSKPYKRHLYFRHTAYSCSRFDKNIQASTVDGRYDVKVEDGYVVWAGSIHQDTGLPYAIEKDVPVVDIPDWLVDWLIEDQARCKARAALVRKSAQDNDRHDPEATRQDPLFKTVPCVRAVKAGIGELVPAGKRYAMLCRYAGKLASLCIPPGGIHPALVAFAEARFQDGKRYVIDRRDTIKKIAFDRTLRQGSVIWLPTERLADRSGLVIRRIPSRHEVMVEALKGATVDALEDGYKYLSRTLAMANELHGTSYTLDRRVNADQKAVQRARQEAGWVVHGRVWVRNPTIPTQDTVNVSQLSEAAV
jgi:hypothetical protein